ncbi:MAG: hypothetical protein O2856_11065 [Planctomycetota bacterium]|nr:hypothetical protein [Planctomycetota bacterium]
MTCQDNEILLNNVLIQMARSFLQYVSESSPWVASNAASDEAQLMILAARQRQDVAEIVAMLDGREHYIDFGSFPTEYTDQQFLSLQAIMGGLICSQKSVCNRISTLIVSLRTAGDVAGFDLLTTVESHERDILRAMNEIEKTLRTHSASAV